MNRFLKPAPLLGSVLLLLASACSAPPPRRINAADPPAALSHDLGGLRDFVGEWTVTVESLTGEAETYVTSGSVRVTAGGFALEEELWLRGPSDEVAQIRGLRTWDPFRELFRVAYIDDYFGLLDIYEGGVEEDGAWVGSNVPTGTSIHLDDAVYWSRYRLRRLDPDRFRMHWEGSEDGGRTWIALYRMTYKRLR